MIIVAGTIELRPEDVATAKSAALTMMAETAKEAGCRHYRFHADLEHPTHLHVYEEWDSEAALKAHFKTPHMDRFRQVLSALTIVRRDFRKFEAGPATPL